MYFPSEDVNFHLFLVPYFVSTCGKFYSTLITNTTILWVTCIFKCITSWAKLHGLEMCLNLACAILVPVRVRSFLVIETMDTCIIYVSVAVLPAGWEMCEIVPQNENWGCCAGLYQLPDLLLNTLNFAWLKGNSNAYILPLDSKKLDWVFMLLV